MKISKPERLPSQTKLLTQLRKQIANEILRNAVYIPDTMDDMSWLCDSAELCDQYSLRLVLNWLAHQKQFFAYPLLGQDASKECLLPLETGPQIAARYPLYSYEQFPLPESLLEALFKSFTKNLTPTEYTLAYLYEHIVSYPLTINADGTINIQMGLHNRYNGIFYTPIDIADLCWKEVFQLDSIGLMKDLKGSRKHKSGKNDPSEHCQKIIDPACGTGIFLLRLIEHLIQSNYPQEAIFHIVANRIYGLDIDGRALELCKWLLLLSQAPYLSALPNLSQQLEQTTYLISQLNQHFVQADTSNLLQTQNLEAEFHAIIANPPYISWGSRGQNELFTSQKNLLKIWYPESAQYKIRFHSIFQQIATRLAGPHGTICLLLPDAFLTGKFYSRLRLFLDKKNLVRSITELPPSIFPNATAGKWVIIIYQRKCKNIACSKCQSSSVTLKSFSNWPAFQPAQSFNLNYTDFVSSDHHRFQLLFTEHDVSISQKLNNLPRLGSVLRGHTGLRSRFGQHAIIFKSQTGNPLARKGIATSGDISQYRVEWQGVYLNVDPQKLWAGGFDPEVIHNPKLMVRQTSDRIIAALDTSGLYHLNNIHSFSQYRLRKSNTDSAAHSAKQPSSLTKLSSSRQKLPLEFYLALLNSTFYLYLYQLRTRERGRALAQIDIELVEQLPIPAPSSYATKNIVLIAKQITKLLGSNHLTAYNSLTESQALKEKIQFYQRAIDSLIYELFPLESDEISHIEAILTPEYIQAKLPGKEKIAELIEHLETEANLN